MTTTPGPEHEHDATDATTEVSAGSETVGSALDEAAEGDLVEQRQALDGTGTVSDVRPSAGEADVADALEQGADLGEDDDDTAYPRADG